MKTRRHTTYSVSVAQHLGVSTTTVHYALHNTGRVSEATRQRVIEAAKQLGYRPNLLARGLRSQRSATLGVVVTTVASYFYAHMLEGIEQVAHQNQHGILLACSNDNPEWE